MMMEFKRQLVNEIFDLCEELSDKMMMSGELDEVVLDAGYERLAKEYGISKEDVIRIEYEAKEFFQKD